MSGDKHLFEIKSNSYSGRIDLGRSPNTVLIRRQRQVVIYEKGKDNNYINRKKRHFIDADKLT